MKKYLLLGALITCLGCTPKDEISTQQVPKEKSGYLSLREPTKGTVASNAGETATPLDRMLVAIYRSDETDWFYKVDGPIADIEAVRDQLMDFFKSASFENGKPVWKLPDGWSEGGERPMRLATLSIPLPKPPQEEAASPGNKSLELAISSLSGGQDLLLNVNRWRGQMSLPPTTQDKLNADLKPLESVPNAFLFSVDGKKGGGMMGGMMGMRGMDTAPSSLQASSSMSNTSVPTFDLSPPEGWTAGKTSSMVPVRFQKAEKESSIQITVTQLPAAANTWGPNLKRWAGEAEMLDLPEEQLMALSSSIEIDGIKGDQVRLVPENESKTRAVIGAMVKKGDNAWFIKLFGSKQMVVENESVFSDLLKRIKFPNQDSQSR